MRNIKQIDIKNCKYYVFSVMTDIKDFDSSLLKIDKKSCKNIGVYNIGYITIKKLMIIKILNCDGVVLEIFVDCKFQ